MKTLVRWTNNCTSKEDWDDWFDGALEFSEGKYHETGNYLGPLECEVGENELPPEWRGDLAKIPSGYYELEYNYRTESESYEMPHIQYYVFEEIVSMKPSVKSFFKYWINKL